MKKYLTMAAYLVLIPEIIWAANLTCAITGLKHLDGGVYIAFYSSSEGFLKEGKQVAQCKTTTPLQKITRLVCSLPRGSYAASVFHDENSNGKLDTNFFHIPKEGYGFSNNAKGSFGPPKFEAALFQMGESDQEITIEMQY